jgi:hypothetical protein
MMLIDPYRFGSSGPPVDDPSNIVALLHFDDVDGSTTMENSASSGLEFFPSGDAHIDTSQYRFGGSSLYLDGSGDRVVSGQVADLNPDAGDWTMELFFRFTSYNRDIPHVWQIGVDGGNRLLLYIPSPSINLTLLRIRSGSVNEGIDCGFRPTVGQWYHAATVRNGGDIRQFINGVAVGTMTTLMPSGNSSLGLGWQQFFGLTADYFNGHIDEVRFVKNEVLYWDDFTPPSLPFPNP